MRNFKLHHSLFIYIVVTPFSLASEITKQFEEIFATTVVLTDSDSISLGFGNFNPEALLKPGQSHLTDHLLEGGSIDLRNQLSVYDVPYTLVLDKNDKVWSDKITFHVAYLRQKSTLDLFDDTSLQPDDNLDKIYSAYMAYSQYYPLSQNWKLRLRVGGYLMHHENNHNYNNPLTNQIKPALDGVYFNTHSNAAIVEPNAKFTYTKNKSWGKWAFSTDINYFIGKVFSGSNSSVGAQPNGWRVNNKIKLDLDVNRSQMHTESVYLKLQRVDIKGDMEHSLQTNHFYEIGIGVLLDTRKFTSLTENVGIGINFNKGSSLYGGSIVLYVNEF